MATQLKAQMNFLFDFKMGQNCHLFTLFAENLKKKFFLPFAAQIMAANMFVIFKGYVRATTTFVQIREKTKQGATRSSGSQYWIEYRHLYQFSLVYFQDFAVNGMAMIVETALNFKN